MIFFGCKEAPKKELIANVNFASLNADGTYMAGDSIQLNFTTTGNADAVLILKNALGTTLVKPVRNKNIIQFKIPNSFSRYAGVCHWNLIWQQKMVVSGDINILPNSTNIHLASYLGPRSISAGEVDYSMMVVSPTDSYDNPLIAGTEVQIKHQFENVVQEHTLEVKNLISWKNIYAPTKSGRILVTASCNATISKELTSIVFPDKAVDFIINYKRNHKYADGNQIVTFSTDIIYDKYGSIISDGTLVSFFVEDTSGMLLRTMGTTINGIAQAKLLHPIKKEGWNATAYITGVAKSNTITIVFEPAILDFNLTVSKDQRTITIGPLKSFMKQIVPDGIPISIHILDAKNDLLEVQETTSRLGLGNFVLSPEFFPTGTYNITIEVGGLKKIKSIVLE